MIWDRHQQSSSRLASKRRDTKKRSRTRNNSKTRRGYANVGTSLPPVMVRGMTAGAAAGNSKAFNRSRRRIDIPLSVPGAEVRLPSIPQIRIGWRLLSFVLVLLSCYLIYEFWNAEEYMMDMAEVTGLKHITSREVNAFLAVQGKPVFLLNPITIEQELLNSFAEFSDVSVQIEFPNTLKIEVVERAPVLIWSFNGLNMLIAEDGSAYQQRDKNIEINQLPIIKSDTSPSEVNTNGQNFPGSLEINQLQQEVPFGVYNSGLEKDDILLSANLISAILLLNDYVPDRAELLYDEVRGLMWEDERGWDVYFGDSTNIELKIDVYKAILNDLKNEELKPEIISVEYPHNPYYRLKE